eukprot:8981451-Pyramimonas_sp.AAC.1
MHANATLSSRTAYGARWGLTNFPGATAEFLARRPCRAKPTQRPSQDTTRRSHPARPLSAQARARDRRGNSAKSPAREARALTERTIGGSYRIARAARAKVTLS